MDDYQLTNSALDKRVATLFAKIGCTATVEPRGVKDDVYVEPPDSWKPQHPIAIETKGPPKTDHIRTNDLRQLDDWVFSLSREKEIRRRTLTEWRNPLLRRREIGPTGKGNVIFETPGAIPYAPVHPRPVKGMLVFNGPTSVPFSERVAEWFPHNEQVFAEERSFCVISLERLLAWIAFCEESPSYEEQFWQLLHNTNGLCPAPD